MTGIFFFLLAQLSFAYLFSINYKGDSFSLSTPIAFASIIPFLLVSIPPFIIFTQGGKLVGFLFYAVLFYVIAISIMGWRSLARASFSKFGWIRVFGSFIFILSDLMIAFGVFTDYYHKYSIPPTLVSFCIMSTYWISLYCFTYSFQEYLEIPLIKKD